MVETWLQTNRRAFALPIGAALAVGAAALVGAIVLGREPESFGSVVYWLLVGLAVVAGLVGLMLVAIVRIPRIAYDDGRVKFYVRFGPPVEVPLEYVEAFLIGRGPIFFNDDRTETKETTTLICRIAEKAEEFSHVETAPLLAAWCGNFATIRGTWTEPLGIEVVNRLNQRLYDVKRQRASIASGAVK